MNNWPRVSVDTERSYSLCFGCGQDNPIGLKLGFQWDGKTARAFNDVLSKEKAGAIYFKGNTWHFYPKWEHLLGALTLCRTGWPFKRGGHREDLSYPSDGLPQSEAIFERLLVYPIPVHMDDDRMRAILSAIAKAAGVVG